MRLCKFTFTCIHSGVISVFIWDWHMSVLCTNILPCMAASTHNLFYCDSYVYETFVTSNQLACGATGTHGRLVSILTHGCWCNSKIIHCTIKYWGMNNTKLNINEFCSDATPFLPSLPIVYTPSLLFGSLLPLLVFIFAMLTRCSSC